MINPSRLKEEISEVICKIVNRFPNTRTYCINLVGSIVKKYNTKNNIPFDIHDIDVFILTSEPAEDYVKSLSEMFVKENASYRHIDELDVWAFKYFSNNICFSFHVVDYILIKNIVKQHDNPSIYDISLVSFRLNYPTVYRTWIIDSICIGGDETILNELQFKLKKKRIPENATIQLKRKILQYIEYARELHEIDEFANIIIINQLLEKLISLCYVENNMYYGTLKLLDEDIKNFTHSKQVVSLCREISSNFQWMKNNRIEFLDLIESVIKDETI